MYLRSVIQILVYVIQFHLHDMYLCNKHLQKYIDFKKCLYILCMTLNFI